MWNLFFRYSRYKTVQNEDFCAFLKVYACHRASITLTIQQSCYSNAVFLVPVQYNQKCFVFCLHINNNVFTLFTLNWCEMLVLTSFECIFKFFKLFSTSEF